ncbi:VWA domain-containing protein [Fulvimarina sp. 2208YS6-2-32]|uniref:VWA domain-containing protein n=1 Tax=Fulvimarina uroteuthidis TaxID=3098149 RepID=A0ABU5I6M3_9HYPH|nr:VWA domain-containing protein [Fulvimarina sp. 2208YS6-2-32]MDY8110408.1 VWA domain-containing protein [Fulvimarina sp. 2208YS6-2-32]
MGRETNGTPDAPLLLEADPDGRLADNIAYFARALRRAGLKLGPSATLDAIAAAKACGFASREDFYWTLHATLVTRREDSAVFDEAFRLFWRSRELIEKMIAMFSPKAPPRQSDRQKPRAGAQRAADSLFEGQDERTTQQDKPELEIDASMTFSGNEVLRDMDFAQMSAAELRSAQKAIAALRLPEDTIRTRRFKPDMRGATIDARATMRSAMRTGGDLLLPRYRTPRRVHPPLIVLADISGSMSQYSRIFLHFLHAIMEQRRRVHAFLFGTRLTNVTRQLRRKDPDQAFADCADQVKDWSGGTRIAEALHHFNRDWSRRVLGQGAIVLLITDGLERDSAQDLGTEMQRLHLSCKRLIWLNPLLRFEGFSARAKGVRTMLEHVDEFRAVHSIDAMAELCAVLSNAHRPENDPKAWLRAVPAGGTA